MPDVYTQAKRSEVMSLIPGKGNKETEQALLALLKQHHITGWRSHLPLPGKPDFAFPKQGVAVFADGSFWRGGPEPARSPEKRAGLRAMRGRTVAACFSREFEADGKLSFFFSMIE